MDKNSMDISYVEIRANIGPESAILASLLNHSSSRECRLHVPFMPGNPSLHFIDHPEVNMKASKTPRYDLRTVN